MFWYFKIIIPLVISYVVFNINDNEIDMRTNWKHNKSWYIYYIYIFKKQCIDKWYEQPQKEVLPIENFSNMCMVYNY